MSSNLESYTNTQARVPSPASAAPKFNAQKYSILMVDDDEKQLSVFRGLLVAEGFNVFTFTTPRAALAKLRESKMDIVISDFNMPGANGREFIHYLRKVIPKEEQPPIILLSASLQSMEVLEQLIEADVFCQKQQAEKNLVKQVKFLLMNN